MKVFAIKKQMCCWEDRRFFCSSAVFFEKLTNWFNHLNQPTLWKTTSKNQTPLNHQHWSTGSRSDPGWSIWKLERNSPALAYPSRWQSSRPRRRASASARLVVGAVARKPHTFPSALHQQLIMRRSNTSKCTKRGELLFFCCWDNFVFFFESINSTRNKKSKKQQLCPPPCFFFLNLLLILPNLFFLNIEKALIGGTSDLSEVADIEEGREIFRSWSATVDETQQGPNFLSTVWGLVEDQGVTTGV